MHNSTELQELFDLVKKTHKYGSFYRHMSTERRAEMLNKVREFPSANRLEESQLSPEEVTRIMNTRYGLPPR